jgi:hypothetical protein
VPHDNHSVFIDHDRLPEAELLDRLGHSDHGGVVDPRVVFVRLDLGDVASRLSWKWHPAGGDAAGKAKKQPGEPTKKGRSRIAAPNGLSSLAGVTGGDQPPASPFRCH